MSQNLQGFLEKISWKAILGATVTALALYFAFPDYVLNIRPQIERIVGIYTLSFIEGAISGTLITVLVLKFLAERGKTPQVQIDKKK